MSDPTCTLSKTVPASHSRLSNKDREELLACEKATRIIKKVNNLEPYINTIPQDHDKHYRHHSYISATQHRRETGFQRDEPEHMQYMSFVHLPQEGIIQQHAMSVMEKSAEPKSGSPKGTPSLGPKKNISFNDYKKKAAGGTAAEMVNGNGVTKLAEKVAEKQTAIKGPAEKVREETREVLRAAEELESGADISRASASTRAVSASHQDVAEAKRKRSGDEEGPLVKHAKTDVDERPAKKARLSPAHLPDASESLAATGPGSSSQPLSATNLTKQAPVRSPSKEVTASQSTTSNDIALPPKLSPIKVGHHKSPLQSPTQNTRELPPKLSPLQQHSRKVSSPPSARDADRLPRKLSPLRAERITPESFDRLSPTLPENILTALEQKDKLRREAAAKGSSATTSASKKDSMLTPNDAVNGTKHRSPAPRNGFRANSHSPAAAELAVQPSSQTSQPLRKESPVDDDDDTAEQSLIVKLKIKKSMRPDVKRLLAFPGGTASNRAPRASSAKPTDPHSSESTEPRATDKSAIGRDAARRSGKGVAQKIVPSTKKTVSAEKRPRDESEPAEPPAKKQKADDAPSGSQPKQADAPAKPLSPDKRRVPEPLQLKGRSTTPAQPDLRTPTSSSALKSQLATPAPTNNRLAAVAMTRDPSRESNYDTPTAISLHTPPPNSLAHNTAAPVPTVPTSAPGSKTADQVVWEGFSKLFLDLGPTLKHAATAASTTQPDKPHLAALLALESLLAFTVADHCADQAALASDPPSVPALYPWRQLPPFWNFVQRHCTSYPLLAGIAAHLTVLITTHILTLAAQSPDRAPSRESILDILSTQAKARIEAKKHLDVHALITSFPQSWAKADRTASAPGADSLDVATLLLGRFDLPISNQSSPLIGVRAALAMLEEWVSKEGVEYTFKVKTR